MKVLMLKSKIHMATITNRVKYYDGSITIDKDIAKMAGLREYEKVLVADVNTGNRFETYVIYGSNREFCINGAAANLVRVGDRIIVMAFGLYDSDEVQPPIILRMNEKNEVI